MQFDPFAYSTAFWGAFFLIVIYLAARARP